jgi:hypothetical protein
MKRRIQNTKQIRANKGRGDAGERCDSNIRAIFQQETQMSALGTESTLYRVLSWTKFRETRNEDVLTKKRVRVP